MKAKAKTPRPLAAQPMDARALRHAGSALSKMAVGERLDDDEVADVQDLIVVLRAIQQGADAKRLFGQRGRTKPKLEARNMLFGIAYWTWRAALGPPRKAMREANALLGDYGYDDVKSKRSAEKIIRETRQWAFDHLDEVSIPGLPNITQTQLAALRADIPTGKVKPAAL